MAQTVKNSPLMQESWFQSLGWEDALEKGMGTHSSILAWRIPWTEEPAKSRLCKEPTLKGRVCKELDMIKHAHTQI